MTIDSLSHPTQQVLIVDDEVINLKVLSNLLRDEASIILAKSGKQAIRKARELRPDLIILDIKMPEMDGFETLSELHQLPQTAAIPVIFITGLSDEHYEEKGLLLGAADYIFKPFHPGIVKARVHTHLQLVRQRTMLEHLANCDSLTSLANRRYYKKILTREWINAIQNKQPVSLAIFDIDNFKHYNDEFGHDAGDHLLCQVSSILASQFDQEPLLISRFGGEEFVALMPTFGQPKARQLIEQSVKQVSDHTNVTISAGGSSCIPNDTTSSSTLFSKADKALYVAKGRGKNCVVWSEEHFV
ncbi:diguanylate cyclase [Celerinatantimonas diazotrophica]|uniref:diguanylate cyclase n=1 Tax=Celerinatantimonas diazotrophica TaxID=412034 RepID=A0A4R1J7E6_9GAMM|nr:diguanylate cyclase [Celerinatantimonas diazotrophica]TCK46410.1 response regulator receiver modulated diguanylate cyclase [Celerinatantimonas diazotrophica]CAG9295214.1 Response regulator PleD [Celerinatantimonas diazotrophica]